MFSKADRNDLAGEPFAVARDRVGGSGREFAHDSDPFDEFLEFLEQPVHDAFDVGETAFSGEFATFGEMKLVQSVEQFESLIPVPGYRFRCDGKQFIRGLAHRGNNNDRLPRRAWPGR